MGLILTFYSYKGGTGRTMALANVAVLMAQWGYKVLMIDWDLEAPGLENFFRDFFDLNAIQQKKGIIELLLSPRKDSLDPGITWSDWITPIQIPDVKGSLHLVTAGQRTKKYFPNVRSLNVDKFYLEQGGGQFIELLRNDWKEAYDFVLIDSRTGVTDIGGICTVQLPDILVLLFTPTEQSLRGILEVAEKAFLARQRLPVDRMSLISVPVPSRFDTIQEREISQEWLDRLAIELKEIYADWLPTSIRRRDILELTKLPYIPYFSFGEKLPVLEKGTNDPSGLGFAYQTLTALLINKLETVEQIVKERILVSSVPQEQLDTEKTMPLVSKRPRERKDVLSMNWSEEDWNTLIYTIQRQHCILLLGPDVMREEVEGTSFSLSEILSSELAQSLRPEITQQIDLANLTQVSQYYSLEMGRNALVAQIRNFYDKRHYVTSEIHRNLAALPFSLTLLSTPDRMFPHALKETGKSPIIERYNYHGKNQEILQAPTLDNPLLFYLYGIIDEPESLVITEQDVLDFLKAIISMNPPLPNYLLSELQNKNNSLLFLGFGFKNWYVRLLLSALQGHDKESRSFALEQFIPNDLEEFRSTVLFFRSSDYKIQIYRQDFHHFVRELRERYEMQPIAEYSEIHVSKIPTVYICSASEDKALVNHLSERLEAAGFNVWADEEMLQAGDKWNEIIEHAINSEFDYFIILQSHAMDHKYWSYFHKEIRLALERQKYFRPGIRFIIPAIIDDSPLLEDVEHLQSIDLSDKANVEKLISIMKRDQQRRIRR